MPSIRNKAFLRRVPARLRASSDRLYAWISELERENCIRRYVIDGQTYIAIPNWLKHQKIDKPTPSKLPEFDDSSRLLASPPRRKGMEGKGEDQEGKRPLAPSAKALDDAAPPVFLAIPLVGKQGEFAVTEPMVAEWETAFPGIDVRQKLRTIRQWDLSNPKKRKTRNGILQHITGWLAKDQDKNPSEAGPSINPPDTTCVDQLGTGMRCGMPGKDRGGNIHRCDHHQRQHEEATHKPMPADVREKLASLTKRVGNARSEPHGEPRHSGSETGIPETTDQEGAGGPPCRTAQALGSTPGCGQHE